MALLRRMLEEEERTHRSLSSHLQQLNNSHAAWSAYVGAMSKPAVGTQGSARSPLMMNRAVRLVLELREIVWRVGAMRGGLCVWVLCGWFVVCVFR